MTSVCPSCSRPLPAVSTPEESAETVPSDDVIVCRSCGFVIANEPVGETGDVGERSDGAPSISQRRIAHFRLLRLLGKGGFGAVWLAEDLNLGRRVALKLPKSTSKDAKLLHEAKTAAKLRHPRIVAIYEIGTAGDQVYIASEYIDGVSLRELIDRRRLPVEQVVSLVKTVAEAVDHAHANHVVHRDLKPANIIIDSGGQPHVTDFGIAKQLSENETISSDGQVIGTVAYMSPEQARGKTRETDHRSDIYAIGTMLFELLTEYRPFRGNPRGILHQKLYEDPPSPRKLVPLLRKDLETICLKCLEREPAKRYQSAAAVADELERFQQGMPIQARPVSGVEKAIRWCKRNKAVCGLMLSVFFSLLIGLLGTSYFWLQSERNARQRQQALYRTHMVLASNQWSGGDVTGLRNTLATYASDKAGSDQRDFEWHYFSESLGPFVQITDHGDAVTDVAVSRNGALLASAGRDRVVRVWDTQSGDLVRTLQARAGPIGVVEFSARSDRLLSTHRDGRVRLWNPLQHGNEAASFAHGPRLIAARFDPSGNTVVSIDSDGSLRWWDIASVEETHRVDHLGPSVRDIAYSPAGDRLAIARRDGTIIVIDAENGQQLHEIGTRIPLYHIAYAGNGRSQILAGGTDKIAAVSLREPVHVEFTGYDGEAVGDIEILPSTDQAAVVLSNNSLLLLGADGEPTRVLPTHSLSHGVLSRSWDGRFLAIGSGDGTVKLLDVARLQAPQVLWHAKHVRDVAFVDKGNQIVTCSGDGSVLAWDMETGQRTELISPSGREMLSVTLGRDAGVVFAAGMFPEIVVLDPTGRTARDSIPLPLSGIGSLDVSPDGRLLAAGSRSGVVLVYEIANKSEPLFRINQPDTQVTELLFSPNGETLAVGYSSKQVAVIRIADQETDHMLRFDSVPQSLAYSETGDLVVVGTHSGQLHFVDLVGGTTHSVDAHQGRINAVGFFPGCRRLVSGGRDKNINLWDVDSRQRVAVLSGHQRQIFGIDVSPDGQSLASVGLDGDLRLWRIATHHSAPIAKEPISQP